MEAGTRTAERERTARPAAPTCGYRRQAFPGGTQPANVLKMLTERDVSVQKVERPVPSPCILEHIPDLLVSGANILDERSVDN